MIITPDSCAVNSPDELSLGEIASGADYDLSTLGEMIPDEKVCWWCGMPDGDEKIVERHFRPLRCRKSGGAGVRVLRLLRPLCTDCIEALELDWCVDCREWHPKHLIGPDDELCPACRIVKALGMVADMANVERSYAVSQDAEGWVNFRGETPSDCASVLIVEKRELTTAVAPGPFPRFSDQVFLGVAAIWRTFPQARERFSVAGGAA